MTELLFQAITGPQPGEGTEWWKLRDAADATDLSDGVLSDGTLYIHPFEVTTKTFTVGNDVERIVFPGVNVKIDRQEILLEDKIRKNAYKNKDLKELVQAIGDTGQNVEAFIEDPFRGNKKLIRLDQDYRQSFTEGPFKTEGPLGKRAFADGFYVGVNLAALPTFPSYRDGVVVRHKAKFNLGELPIPPDEDKNPLQDTYKRYQGFGLFPQDNTYTFKLDLNKVTGRNKNDYLPGTNQRDLMFGRNGRDRLTGAGGNDYLDGGNGKDILNGTGRGTDGSGEIDVLRGGNGKDIFVLGRCSTTYYLGGGDSDYAIIEDFKIQKDLLKLGSHPGDYDVNGHYTIGGRSGAAISFHGDLVAIVVGVSADHLTPLEDFVI